MSNDEPMSAEQSEAIRDIILSRGARDARRIDPTRVPTAAWVRLKCQNGCGGYGRCLTCPPHSPTPERMRRILDGYRTAFVIHWGEESAGRRVLAQIEREVFFRGYHKAFTLASGPCRLCQECDTTAPCRHPDAARPAMEACGIDVFQTAREVNFPIRTLTSRDETPNFYSLLLVE